MFEKNSNLGADTNLREITVYWLTKENFEFFVGTR